MKNLVFTLATAQNETPIKNSLLEKIEQFKLEKKETFDTVLTRAGEMLKMQKAILEQLNKELGVDAWFLDSRDLGKFTYHYCRSHNGRNKQESFGVSIGFRNGIYKNTCYNDWDLIIQTPFKEVKTLSNISFKVPDLDVIELYLVKTHHNFENKSQQISHLITDLNQLHKILEYDYTTFLLNQKK